MYYGRGGLGDAQIDAQNATTATIGQIGTAYAQAKAAGQLTVTTIQDFMNQVQAAVNSYKTQWGGTSRGAAGAQTLQQFVDSAFFPNMRQDMAAIQAAGGQAVIPQQAVVPVPATADSGSGGLLQTLVRTVENVISPGTPVGGQGFPGTPGNPVGPGNMLPPVQSSSSSWLVPAAIGLGLAFLFTRK